MLMYGVSDMPKWGDPHSPASLHVSPRYIEKPLEATVIFTAAIACLLILRKRKKEKDI